MAKMKNAVMAGCLDERTSLHFILIMNFILSGFYYVVKAACVYIEKEENQ